MAMVTRTFVCIVMLYRKRNHHTPYVRWQLEFENSSHINQSITPSIYIELQMIKLFFAGIGIAKTNVISENPFLSLWSRDVFFLPDEGN